MIKAKIRPLVISDLDNIMKWINDPDIMRNFQNFDKVITREAEEEFLKKLLKSKDDLVFAIETESNDYIGNISLHNISAKNRLGRMAIIIGNKKYQGKGYGISAAQELLKIGFEKYKMNKIWLIVFEENLKARHIYEKVGFKVEGILKEEYVDRNGKFHNMVRMAILRKEYDLIKSGVEV